MEYFAQRIRKLIYFGDKIKEGDIMPKLIHERLDKLLAEGEYYSSEEIDKTEFEYKVTGNLKIVLLVSKETVNFKVDETKTIAIEDVIVPPCNLILSSMYGIHPIGHISAIGSFRVPLSIIDEERRIDYAMFHAAMDGRVSKDEVVGAAIIVPVEPK